MGFSAKKGRNLNSSKYKTQALFLLENLPKILLIDIEKWLKMEKITSLDICFCSLKCPLVAMSVQKFKGIGLYILPASIPQFRVISENIIKATSLGWFSSSLNLNLNLETICSLKFSKLGYILHKFSRVQGVHGRGVQGQNLTCKIQILLFLKYFVALIIWFTKMGLFVSQLPKLPRSDPTKMGTPHAFSAVCNFLWERVSQDQVVKLL